MKLDAFFTSFDEPRSISVRHLDMPLARDHRVMHGHDE
jgi:hypothetical protein